MKTTDVYAALPEDRSDTANHARNVVIARHKHVTMRCRFEMKTVNLRYTSFTLLSAIAKERSRKTLCRGTGADLSVNCRRAFTTRANVGRRYFYSTLFCDQKSVHDIHTRADVAQQSRKKCTRHRRRIDVDDFASILNPDLAHRFVNKLRLKTT